MGLLKASDWKARWISAPAPPEKPGPANPFAGLRWVWMPGEDALSDVPAETRYFRGSFTLPAGRVVKSARFLITADDRFRLFVNGRVAGHGDLWSHPERLSIEPMLRPGVNTLAIEATNNASQAGLLGRLSIAFSSGQPLEIPVDETWKVSRMAPSGWTDAGFDDSGWPRAAVVAPVGEGPWGIPGQPAALRLPPSPLLRTGFQVDRSVRRATLYITALGLYEARVNGHAVGGFSFTPGWTDYRKRLSYQTYDVTALIGRGRNVLGAVLADGWACGYVAFGRRDLYGVGRPRLLAQLELEYADGSRQTVGTGPAWRGAYGPIREADILMGETYDARTARPGWDTASFHDTAWKRVEVRPAWPAPLTAYAGEPVRRVMELAPVRRTQPKPGVWVFDMGQNMDGWVRLRVKGPRGAKVTLRFGELLSPDGTAYTGNLRTARATDAYTLRGVGTEAWEPRFTYHGFRYVEVAGYPGTPSLNAIRGVVVSSFSREAGRFASSSPVLNKLWKNIVWTQRDNYIEIPTGCAQRDERLGWTGDAQLFARTSTAAMDAAPFLTKWMVDLDDDQLANGAFPDVAPDVMGGGGSSGWSDAGLIIPWTVYQVYGDRDIIRRHWPAMQRWIAVQEKLSQGLLRPAAGYGDWLSAGENTPLDVISTAWFAHGASLMAKMARVIGRPEDALRYDALAARVRDAFVNAYVTADGRVKGESQTAYAMALAFDLLPVDRRARAVERLVADVQAHNGHLTTGFLGAGLLAPVLTRYGHAGLAARMVQQPTYPGWGYQIRQGATTLWERWDSWTPERGFADASMNSFNHFAFGSVGEWLIRGVGGLDTDPSQPGFRRIIVHPRIGTGVREAATAYDSVRGPVSVHWKAESGRFRLDVSIPVNTTAIVTVPAGRPADVTESGKPLSRIGVRAASSGRGETTVRIGSGTYHFVAVRR
jgi:alpha-L-rhamnosidase